MLSNVYIPIMFKLSKGDLIAIILLAFLPGLGTAIATLILGPLIFGSGILRLTLWISVTGVWIGIGTFGAAIIAIMLLGENPDVSLNLVLNMFSFLGGGVALLGLVPLIWPPKIDDGPPPAVTPVVLTPLEEEVEELWKQCNDLS